ncbi:hypothetical protein DINM_020509 [Dirofilaria immitis]|nr:hypothetical protein [Dirofilaria immitis]
MTTLATSRTAQLLRSHHSSDCGIMLRKFQTFARLRTNHRWPKINTDIEVVDDGLPKDYRLQVFKLSSRRLDSIVCKATGKGRGQAEKMILTGKVQVNEENIPKKAAYYVRI